MKKLSARMMLLIYRCPICRLVYRERPIGMLTACGVRHAPGTCCHHGEEEITFEKLEAIFGILHDTSVAS